MNELIRVDFRRPVPLFPLSDTVLLPYAVLPLHVFEPRYRQMVDRCLDGSGQIAMATYAGKQQGDVLAEGFSPALRPAVCLGQIIAHERLSDGRFKIQLHGLCRGMIEEILEPDDDRLFRLARLAPAGDGDADAPPMSAVRGRLGRLVRRRGLRRVRGMVTLQEWIDRDDVPTPALLELIGFAIVRDSEMRYRLLAEPDPAIRARMIIRALHQMESLVVRAEQQGHERWPKGVSWN